MQDTLRARKDKDIPNDCLCRYLDETKMPTWSLNTLSSRISKGAPLLVPYCNGPGAFLWVTSVASGAELGRGGPLCSTVGRSNANGDGQGQSSITAGSSHCQ